MGGDDRFVFADNLTLSGTAPTIDGGLGNDILDYSAFTTTLVNVDMQSGTAMNISGGFTGIETVIGGRNNVLYGTTGNDTLTGGSGNDTLVGRGGDDTYIFVNGWGVDTVIELANEGNDTFDFSAVTTALISTSTTSSSRSPVARTPSRTPTATSRTSSAPRAQTRSTSLARTVSMCAATRATTFVFADAATLDGTLNGEGGTDTARLLGIHHGRHCESRRVQH